MTTQQTLSDLLEAFGLNSHDKTKIYSDVAARLSKLAGKSPAWGPDWIQSVAAGKQPTSKKLARAVQVLAAEIDGTPAAIADSEPVVVYARPGSVQPGALLVGESRTCKYPPCTIHFIRTHPRQEYCPVHRDPKTRR